jgi:hypothetical protein
MLALQQLFLACSLHGCAWSCLVSVSVSVSVTVTVSVSVPVPVPVSVTVSVRTCACVHVPLPLSLCTLALLFPAFSSVVREPLNGEDTVLPLDPTIVHPVTSHRSVIRSLVALCEVGSPL